MKRKELTKTLMMNLNLKNPLVSMVYNILHFSGVRVNTPCINPLSTHDALKHHFTSLKTDRNFLQPRVIE